MIRVIAEPPPDNSPQLTIVLADDHPVVRSALRLLLDAEADLEVVAEAGTAEDAFRYTRGHRPDVLVLDLIMPGHPSLEVIPEIRQAVPATAIVVLTMHDDPALARAALGAGAVGYVLKEAADTECCTRLGSPPRASSTSIPASGRSWRASRPTQEDRIV